MAQEPSESAFPFRPWVRSTCRKAMLWGIGVVAVLGVTTWYLRSPGEAHLFRAFGALVFYGLLFWLTLAKIWWTAGKPAVLLDDDSIGYQPLHTFRPKRLRYADVLACSPRKGTSSLRFAHRAGRDRAKELFLNLAVVDERRLLMRELGERLGAAGLVSVEGRASTWRRPGWEDESL